MKTFYLLLLSISFNLCLAQNTTVWTKNDQYLYGSRKEKLEQDALFNRYGSKRYRLIGYKEYYMIAIIRWLKNNNYTLTNQTHSSDSCKMVFLKKFGSNDEKLFLNYFIDKDKRITAVKITGYSESVNYLFAYYWPDISITSSSQLSHDMIAKKTFIDEHIIYNFKGNSPYIQISK